MTTVQKIIKYLALAFAFFLIVSIFSGIFSFIYILTGNDHKEGRIDKDYTETTIFADNDLSSININLYYTNLIIKTGENLRIDTDNTNISCKQDIDKIKITENNNFFKNDDKELIIYIPEDLEFEKVEINTVVGKVNIEKLKSKKISFELGVGETKISQLEISDKAEIEGGLGDLNILDANINDLNFNMGMGENAISGIFTGKNEIKAGIGNLNINIKGEKNNYKLKTTKGMGSIKIDNSETLNEQITGDGSNYIEIDGGVGNIDIKFEDQAI